MMYYFPKLEKTLPNLPKINITRKLTLKISLVSKVTNGGFRGRSEVFLSTRSLHFPFSCTFIWPVEKSDTNAYYR